MRLERYEYLVYKEFTVFEFFSEGPKGIIKKVVEFVPKNSNGKTYFNLSFGDWNEEKNGIDDMIVTNNMDRKKVLATVAAIVLMFTEKFPDMLVYAEGSTSSRTRLYQIGIAGNWEEIDKVIHVMGLLNMDGKNLGKM